MLAESPDTLRSLSSPNGSRPWQLTLKASVCGVLSSRVKPRLRLVALTLCRVMLDAFGAQWSLMPLPPELLTKAAKAKDGEKVNVVSCLCHRKSIFAEARFRYFSPPRLSSLRYWTLDPASRVRFPSLPFWLIFPCILGVLCFCPNVYLASVTERLFSEARFRPFSLIMERFVTPCTHHEPFCVYLGCFVLDARQNFRTCNPRKTVFAAGLDSHFMWVLPKWCAVSTECP